MLKIVSENFIHALLLVLGLFLKISRWVPPRRRDNWRVNGRCNSPIRRNNRDLVRHGEQRIRRIFEDGAAMTGQEKKNAKLTTGERLTKRELNRPKQAYLYKTCVKQNTQETTSAREFLSLNPEGIWGVCTRWPQLEYVFLITKVTFSLARVNKAPSLRLRIQGEGVWSGRSGPPPPPIGRDACFRHHFLTG